VVFDHEAQGRPVGTPDVDALTVSDIDDGHPGTIDEHTARRPVVDCYPFASIETQQRVSARDPRMGDAHVGSEVTSHDQIIARGKTTP
jgi:hypothetical protein